jgi:hypothetical protein
MEICWKYSRNTIEIARVYLPTAGKLGEIEDSIRISMVFHEAKCVMQTLALYPSVFDQSIGLVVVEPCLA